MFGQYVSALLETGRFEPRRLHPKAFLRVPVWMRASPAKAKRHLMTLHVRVAPVACFLDAPCAFNFGWAFFGIGFWFHARIASLWTIQLVHIGAATPTEDPQAPGPPYSRARTTPAVDPRAPGPPYSRARTTLAEDPRSPDHRSRAPEPPLQRVPGPRIALLALRSHPC